MYETSKKKAPYIHIKMMVIFPGVSPFVRFMSSAL